MISPKGGLIEQVDGPVSEEFAAELGLEGATLMPGSEHITGDRAGAAGKDEEGTQNSVHHRWLSPKEAIGGSAEFLEEGAPSGQGGVARKAHL